MPQKASARLMQALKANAKNPETAELQHTLMVLAARQDVTEKLFLVQSSKTTRKRFNSMLKSHLNAMADEAKGPIVGI